MSVALAAGGEGVGKSRRSELAGATWRLHLLREISLKVATHTHTKYFSEGCQEVLLELFGLFRYRLPDPHRSSCTNSYSKLFPLHVYAPGLLFWKRSSPKLGSMCSLFSQWARGGSRKSTPQKKLQKMINSHRLFRNTKTHLHYCCLLLFPDSVSVKLQHSWSVFYTLYCLMLSCQQFQGNL